MNVEPKTPAQSRVIITQLILPHHTNQLGTVFGGAVLSWMDVCGAMAAARHAQHQVVTASIDELHFFKPAWSGWFMQVIGQVCYVGSSSLDVFVQVWSENVELQERYLTAQCLMTFVALDSQGRKIRVPPLKTVSPLEKLLWELAEKRRQIRLQHKDTLWPQNLNLLEACGH